MKSSDSTNERIFGSKLDEAISLLTHELCAWRKQREEELAWFKSHAGFSTKRDLKETEDRIIKAIGGGNQDSTIKDATADLSQAADVLEKAVQANQP